MIHPVLLGILIAIPVMLAPWPGIQWGDGLEFAAVASHLGVAHPPGYPLFTLIGWMFIKVLPVEPYNALVLMSRLCIVVASVLAGRLVERACAAGERATPASLAAAVAVLLPFSGLFAQWLQLVEVYAFGIMLMAGAALALDPFRKESLPLGRITLGAVLLGCSAANHLPSLALAPLLVVQAYRSAGFSPRAFAALLPAALIPLLFYGTMPLRRTEYGIYTGGLNSFAELLSHVRGGEYAQYRFMMLIPGLPFTFSTWLVFAGERLLMLVGSWGGIFFGDGPTSLLAGFLTIPPFLIGLHSALSLRGQRLPILAILLAPLLQVVFVLLYNIADIADYFPCINLFLLPFFLRGLLVGAEKLLRMPATRTLFLRTAFGLALVATLATRTPLLFSDSNSFAESWRTRLLAALPPDAAILTTGDADIFTLWYTQFSLKERPDLAVVGANFLRFEWAHATIRPSDSARELVRFHDGPPPGSMDSYLTVVSQLAIDPLLTRRRVFTTNPAQDSIAWLQQRYRLRRVAMLLTNEEVELILNRGDIYLPSSELIEILPK